MEAGDTYRFGRGGHLWVVVSDPAKDAANVVVVNMTTDRGNDNSCILHPGDHPFVRHATCMCYDKAYLVSNADLERHVSSNTVRLQERVSAEVLERIRAGAAVTEQIPIGCKQVLIDQGLIES